MRRYLETCNSLNVIFVGSLFNRTKYINKISFQETISEIDGVFAMQRGCTKYHDIYCNRGNDRK